MAKGECSCWLEYPNERHKRKNGWKCVDEYECIKPLRYNANGTVKFKTVCRKKEVVDDGETATERERTRH